MARTVTHRLAPYGFLLPFFCIFVLFWLWPLLRSFTLSLTDWTGGQPHYVGFRNFTALLDDKDFLVSVRNTLVIAGASVFVIMPLALFLAVLLNNPLLRFRDTIRLVVFLPVVMSLVVAAMIFRSLFDHNFGLVRYVLDLVGASGMPDLLSSKAWSLPVLIVVLAWRWTGYNMLFFLAALQAIPRSVTEAAMIDGAGRAQNFFHITVPMLKPVTIFVAVQSLIGAFQVFEEPLIITGGGPGNSSLTLALHLYRKAFEYSEFGYASAIAVVQFVLILALCLTALKLSGAFAREP